MIIVKEDNNVFVVPDGTKVINKGDIPEDVTKVIIPNGVKEIGDSAFNWCESLTSVKIPDSVTKIDNFAFYHCKSLKSVNIPNGVTKICDHTFNGCHSLKSVNIPNGVTEIGDSAFSNCHSLKSVNIPNGVTKIGKYAFYGCESLESVSIPNSVTKIGEDAFTKCPLKNIDASDKIKKLIKGNHDYDHYEDIDEARYYCIKNLKPESTSEFLEDRLDWVDEDGAEAYEDVLKGSSKVYCLFDDNTGGEFGDYDSDEWAEIFEPMQYANFYGGTGEEVSSGGPGGGAVTVLHTKFGDIIQEGGGGYSMISFSNKTRNGLLKFLSSK